MHRGINPQTGMEIRSSMIRSEPRSGTEIRSSTKPRGSQELTGKARSSQQLHGKTRHAASSHQLSGKRQAATSPQRSGNPRISQKFTIMLAGRMNHGKPIMMRGEARRRREAMKNQGGGHRDSRMKSGRLRTSKG